MSYDDEPPEASARSAGDEWDVRIERVIEPTKTKLERHGQRVVLLTACSALLTLIFLVAWFIRWWLGGR